MNVFLYKLTDPRGIPFCYVGCTADIQRRYGHHKSASHLSANPRFSHWLKGLKEHCLQPDISLIDVVSEKEAPQAEQDVISAIRAIRGSYWLLNSPKTCRYSGKFRQAQVKFSGKI